MMINDDDDDGDDDDGGGDLSRKQAVEVKKRRWGLCLALFLSRWACHCGGRGWEEGRNARKVLLVYATMTEDWFGLPLLFSNS